MRDGGVLVAGAPPGRKGAGCFKEPMAEVEDGPKFPAEGSNRRDTMEEFEEEEKAGEEDQED